MARILSGIEAFAAALAFLKPDRIAGAGGLQSRHDAMLAAETGADYVMFGDPAAARRRAPFDEALERLSWWAELFEIACVGYAASRDEIAPLAQTGADFIALGEWIWTEPHNTAATIAAAAQTPRRAGRADDAAALRERTARSRGEAGVQGDASMSSRRDRRWPAPLTAGRAGLHVRVALRYASRSPRATFALAHPASAQPKPPPARVAPPVQYMPETAAAPARRRRANPTSPSAPISAAISSPPSNTPPTTPRTATRRR